MKTELNKYTIDDFLKLKPIIYEYCKNLTPAKSATSWCRRKEYADDLYQDVYVYMHCTYFKKEMQEMSYGKFVQIMKNSTYWIYHRRFNMSYKVNRVNNNLNYIDESERTMWHFTESHPQRPDVFNLDDLKSHPDYKHYTKGLKTNELKVIELLLQGYTKTEISRMNLTYYADIYNIVSKVQHNALTSDKKYVKPIIRESITFKKVKPLNDLEFVKSKVKNFDKIFLKDTLVQMFSLYLQGYDRKSMSKVLNKSIQQLNVEIYRINQKIKKYDFR